MSDATRRELCRRIWSLAWPTVLFAALEMTVGLADLLMVRPLGPAATAAIGVSRQVTFLVEAAAIAISTGVITLVSQGVCFASQCALRIYFSGRETANSAARSTQRWRASSDSYPSGST